MGLSIAPFVSTPIPVVRRMLLIAELKRGEILYDLGCGDGRIPIIAAQEFGAIGVGVDINWGLVRKAKEKVAELGLEGRVRIIHADLFDVDISPADVVTLYLTTGANEKVRPKLEKELKAGARVVSHDFEVPKWRPARIERFKERYRTHNIYLYRR